MAARTNKIRHDDETRAKIRTSQLINRLENHVFDKSDMKTTQVTAALGLLKKTLPDLAVTELTGKDGGPLEILEMTDKDRARALAAFVAKTKAKT
jgi:hypothetical protein